MVHVKKGFVRTAVGEVHFRYGGRGPVLVMLHDSPRSSVLHAPNIEWLAERCTVIAPDTPGYGNSAPLGGALQIGDFAAALGAVLSALGVGRCALYGLHTGAKIALHFAAEHPDRVAVALLDGLALPVSPPDEPFLREYLPVVGPAADGSHLAQTWSRILDFHRWHPWFERTAATRVALDLPDDRRLHEYATDVLMAGAHWPDAYRAALRYDARPTLARLRVPTLFMARENDVLYRCLDALPQPLPAGGRIERLPAEPLAWRRTILDAVASAPGVDAAFTPPEPGPPSAGQRYVELPHGQMRVRVLGPPRAAGAAGAAPLLLLHDAPGAAVELLPLAERLAADRLVLLPDLPGVGESDPLPAPTAGAYATALAELLERLALAPVDVGAIGLAGPLALALAATRASLVRRLVLDGLPVVRARERRSMSRQYAPPVRPDRFGSQLHTFWHQLRDAEFSWPWFARAGDAARLREPCLAADRLQAVLVELMKQPERYGDAARAGIDASVRTIAAAVRQPTLLLHDPADLRSARAPYVAAKLHSARLERRAPHDDGLAGTCRAFLG